MLTLTFDRILASDDLVLSMDNDSMTTYHIGERWTNVHRMKLKSRILDTKADAFANQVFGIAY